MAAKSSNSHKRGAAAPAKRAKQAADVNEPASRLMMAAGISDLTRAEDVSVVADRVGTLAGVVAQAGVTDLAEGAELLDKATDVEVMSALVGTLSAEDLERGMELARMGGELQVASRIVGRMQMPVLCAFLESRGDAL